MRSAVPLFLALLACPHGLAHAQRAELPALESRRFVLSNGLDVYLEHDPSWPTVSVAVAYRGGSAENPANRAGLAHLTEHVTFQGTRDIEEDELIATLERAGVRDFNGVTFMDDVLYQASGPRDAVATVLWIEAQRMAYVLDHADETTVAHQRLVVAREWAEHVGDHAGSGLGILLMRSLFPASHPYSRAGDATPVDIANLSLRDVRWFYQQHYRPSRARLVVTGDVPLDESERLVRSLFEGIVDRGGTYVPFEHPLTPPTRNRLFIVRAPIPTMTVTVAWVTPAYFEPLDAELDVLGRILCSSEWSALSSRLIHRRRLAVHVSCVQGSEALASTFTIRIALPDRANPMDAIAETTQVLEDLLTTPPSAESIESARAAMVRYVVTSARNQSDRARMLARFNVSSGASLGRYSATEDLARYAAVDAASLARATRLLLGSGSVSIVSRPDPTAPDQGVVVAQMESR